MRDFWIIFTIVLTLLAFYTNFKIRQVLPSRKNLSLLITPLLLLVMLGWEFTNRNYVFLVDNSWFRAVAWTGSTIFGIWLIFIVLSLAIDYGLIIFFGIVKLSDGETSNKKQREKLFRRINIVVFAISVAIAGLGLREALNGPKITLESPLTR